ncbi:MAPEG family protein [Porticoccaceae bacterium]|nr:MAPEG family protein [Porticoccaceae bacterium]
MTIAFWTILAAIALPWLMAALKKSPLAVSGKYSNRAPRAMQPKLEGLSQRAHWAEQNSFEILPAFIAAVLVAHFAGAEQVLVDQLALGFVVSRVLYSICYLTDWATLRSLIWTVGLLFIVGLFVISA